jgi:hypothetical protein
VLISKACACLVERGAVFPRAKFSLKASFRWLPWARRGSGCGQAKGSCWCSPCDFEIAHCCLFMIEMMASLCWHSPMGWSRRPVLLDASSGDSSGPGSHRGCAETATHSAANNAHAIDVRLNCVLSLTYPFGKNRAIIETEDCSSHRLVRGSGLQAVRAGATHPQPCCPQRVGTLSRHLSFAFVCLLCTMSSSAKQAWRKVSTA